MKSKYQTTSKSNNKLRKFFSTKAPSHPTFIILVKTQGGDHGRNGGGWGAVGRGLFLFFPTLLALQKETLLLIF